ncbi:MAG: HRDC domain-containing protein [Thermoanaerobaculia bacterium]
MKEKFFAVPALDPADAEEELNHFLSGHRVLAIDRQLVHDSTAAYWAVCVTWVDGGAGKAPIKRGKIDYREVLPPAEFSVFARLRSLRKTLADKEGVPAYALFTNEQLATMVRQRISTADELGKIVGVGPARVDKYGSAFLEALAKALPELPAAE